MRALPGGDGQLVRQGMKYWDQIDGRGVGDCVGFVFGGGDQVVVGKGAVFEPEPEPEPESEPETEPKPEPGPKPEPVGRCEAAGEVLVRVVTPLACDLLLLLLLVLLVLLVLLD